MDAQTKAAMNVVWARLKTTPQFHPANVDLFADSNGWTRRAGDVVTILSGSEQYNIPITNLQLRWSGSSQDGGGETTRISVEAAGNPAREPLPALRRRDYDTDSRIGRVRRYAQSTQEQLDADEMHYNTEFYKTNKEIGLSAKITGVKLDANGNVVWKQATDGQGNLLYYDDEGNITTTPTDKPVWSDIPEWDNVQGATVWGDMGTSGFMSHMMNSIVNNKGETIAIGSVQTRPGEVLIEAINSRRTGKAQISADNVAIQTASGGGLVMDASGNISLQTATGSGLVIDADGNVVLSVGDVVTKLNSNDNTATINADKINLDGIVTTSTLYGQLAYIDNVFAGTQGVNGLTVLGITNTATLQTKTLSLWVGTDQQGSYYQYSQHTNDLFSTATTTDVAHGFILGRDESSSNKLILKHAHDIDVTEIDGFPGQYRFTVNHAVELGDTSRPADLDLSTAIKSASVADNILTLTQFNGQEVTFSKATTLTGAWDSGTYTVSASPQGEEVSTTLDSITKNGAWSKSQAGDLVQPVKVVTDDDPALTVLTDNITIGAVAHSITPTINTSNGTVTGTLSTSIAGTEFLSTPSTGLGYLRTTAAGGLVTTAMVVTSKLRQLNSDEAQDNNTYGQVATTITLDGTTTIDPGESTTIYAKVGNTAYAQINVTANEGSGGTPTVVVQQPYLDHWGDPALRTISKNTSAASPTQVSSSGVIDDRDYYYPRAYVTVNGQQTHFFEFTNVPWGQGGVPIITENGEYSAYQLGYQYLTGVNVQVQGGGPEPEPGATGYADLTDDVPNGYYAASYFGYESLTGVWLRVTRGGDDPTEHVFSAQRLTANNNWIAVGNNQQNVPLNISGNTAYTTVRFMMDGAVKYAFSLIGTTSGGGGGVNSVDLYSDDWKLQEEEVTVYINGSNWGKVTIHAWPDT